MISITLNLLDYFSFNDLTCILSACRITDSGGITLSRMISPKLVISGSGASTIGTCTFNIDTSIVLS